MNKFVLIVFLALSQLYFTKKKTLSFKFVIGFEVLKNTYYGGKPLEAIYFVKCKGPSKNTLRTFQVIKTNQKLRDFFMSEFVLCEIDTHSKRVFYPLGWENSKINVKDIETDCLNIIKNIIKPIEVD